MARVLLTSACCCCAQAGCFFFEQGLGTMVDNDVWENQVLHSLSKLSAVLEPSAALTI